MATTILDARDRHFFTIWRKRPKEMLLAAAHSQISANSREDSQDRGINNLHPASMPTDLFYSSESEPMTSKLLLSATFGFGLFLAVSGCNSGTRETTTPAVGADSSTHSDSDHDHSDHDHGNGDHAGKTDMEKLTAALVDFSDEDRKSAMKQHFCPVSGEMLGTMGAPGKVEVKGQQVWICCDGCKDKLLADPDTYLPKLND